MKKALVFIIYLTCLSSLASQILESSSEKIIPQSEQTEQIEPAMLPTAKLPSELNDLKNEILHLQELIKKETLTGNSVTGNFGILQKINNIFTFVVDKADKLLSKKFMIATLLILAPLVTIYCTIFGTTWFQEFFYSLSSRTVQNAAELGAPIAAGAFKGAINTALTHKIVVAEIVGTWAGVEALKKIIEKVAEASPSVIAKVAKNTSPVIIACFSYMLTKLRGLR